MASTVGNLLESRGPGVNCLATFGSGIRRRAIVVSEFQFQPYYDSSGNLLGTHGGTPDRRRLRFNPLPLTLCVS
jgi:hypothetical protein